MTLDIHTDKTMILESNFGHPFGVSIRDHGDLNIPVAGIVNLVIPPEGSAVNVRPSARQATKISLIRPSRGRFEPLHGQREAGSEASRSTAKRALRSPTNIFQVPGGAHLIEAIIADNSAVWTILSS